MEKYAAKEKERLGTLVCWRANEHLEQNLTRNIEAARLPPVRAPSIESLAVHVGLKGLNNFVNSFTLI